MTLVWHLCNLVMIYFSLVYMFSFSKRVYHSPHSCTIFCRERSAADEGFECSGGKVSSPNASMKPTPLHRQSQKWDVRITSRELQCSSTLQEKTRSACVAPVVSGPPFAGRCISLFLLASSFFFSVCFTASPLTCELVVMLLISSNSYR